jgi:hypothetical protein
VSIVKYFTIHTISVQHHCFLSLYRVLYALQSQVNFALKPYHDHGCDETWNQLGFGSATFGQLSRHSWSITTDHLGRMSWVQFLWLIDQSFYPGYW